MRAILCNLMAVWLLAVTVLGWCCQPACAVSKCVPISVRTKHTHKASGCRCCCHSQPPVAEIAANCTCSPGCHGICTYVLTPKVKVDSQWILSLFEVSGQVVDYDGLITAQVAAWAPSHAPPLLSPPLRRHLALQVILI